MFGCFRMPAYLRYLLCDVICISGLLFCYPIREADNFVHGNLGAVALKVDIEILAGNARDRTGR